MSNMTLTEFLLKIPCDKAIYCKYIEDLCFEALRKASDMAKNSYSVSEIEEMLSDFRINLPSIIKMQFARFSSIQTESTCQLINDCIANEFYMDCLFASLRKAIAIENGIDLITDKLNLMPSGAQLN